MGSKDQHSKVLTLIATLDVKAVYADVDFVVIAAPTNVGPKYRSNVESSSKVDKRHQKCEKGYVATVCRVDLSRNVYSTNHSDVTSLKMACFAHSTQYSFVA